MYISLAIYSLLIVVGLYWWKKYNDRTFYWASFVWVALIALSLFEWWSNSYLDLSSDGRAVQFFIGTGIRITAMVAVIAIFLKGSRRGKGG